MVAHAYDLKLMGEGGRGVTANARLYGKAPPPNKLRCDNACLVLLLRRTEAGGFEVSPGYIGETLSQNNKKEMQFRSQTCQAVREVML